MKETPATILIVDDDENVLEVTTMFLTSRGYDVLNTASALNVEQIIKEHCPEIVLLDYMLPEMDGITLLKKIRDHFPDTYFILFTGGGSTEVAVEAMKAGATDYIAKPFKSTILLDRIKSVLNVRAVEMINRRLSKEIEVWNKELEKRVNEKAEELEKAYQQILQSEKMAILGYLSTGMAHDIRNPLNTINLFLEILRSDLGNDEEKGESLNIISDNVKRINMILEKLLDSSKRPKYQIQPHNINEIVKNTISLYEYQAFLQHVDIVTDMDPDLPKFNVDYNEMEQLFSNLIINAFHALKRGGKIEIKTKFDDGNLFIYVTDNGQGIKKKDLINIFDPFFTTKKNVKGSGLGLSVVNRVVASYGGTIKVDSELNKYTKFTLKLPLENKKTESKDIEENIR
jgi:signal transduction histidine kinase